MFQLPAPPENEAVLLARAHALAGQSLATLAAQAGLPMPADLKRDKGWVGMLLERYLGASAGSKAEQDFAHLGIELKTIPVDAQGKPLETTFVCVAPLPANSGAPWEPTPARHNLRRGRGIQVERITARHGAWLQIRPKAANSRALTEGIGEHGEPIMTLPRGFYLKKSFTAPLLARHFLL